MPSKTRTPLSVAKFVLAAVSLALCLPVFAHADSFTFGNSGGTNKDVGGAFELINSNITQLNGNPVSGYDLTFSTSKSFTGSLETGGSWAAGGSLTITEGKEVIFQGTFSGPVTWTLESGTGCSSCEYILSGGLTGTYWAAGEGNGTGVAITTGSTTQIDLTTKSGYYTGKKGLSDVGGTTNLVTPIPEPETLGMMSTGLIGLAFALKRKIKGV